MIPKTSITLERWIAGLLALGFGFACTLAWLSWQQYQQFREDQEWTDHTYQVLDRLDDISSGLLRAETHQRGFLLTGVDDYIHTFDQNVSEANDGLDAVADLTADNPQQQARVAQLRPLMTARVERLRSVIRLYHDQGFAAAQHLVQDGTGQALMHQIDQITQTLEQHERTLLAARISQRQRSAQLAGALTVASLLAYLTLLLAAFGLIRRSLAERKAAQETAFRARELAEITLHAIGDGVLITDAQGRVTNLNPVAEKLLGSDRVQLRGVLVDQAMTLIHRHTRQPLPNPAYDALQKRAVVLMDPDAVLQRSDGTEIGIEDSAAPIHGGNGEVIGAVLVFRDVTEHRRLMDKIASLALYDALTGLPNRSLLEDRLKQAIEQAIRDNDKVGLIFMDLDHFKTVNDTLGHAAGDALLKEVAARLVKHLRSADTACRLGGDEFIALLPSLDSPEAVQQVADKLHAAEQPDFQIQGQTVPIRFSMGIAVYPDDAADETELMRKADLRMYEHKQQRRRD